MKMMSRYPSEHISEYLRAISQTLFFKNAYFGLGLLLLFAYFDRNLFWCGLLCSLIGYIYSASYSTPKVLRDWGLLTVNGFFFGIAMASLFYSSPAFLVCLILGAMSIPLLTKASYEVLQHWKLSPYVIPYILSAWVFWLCAKGSAVQMRAQAWPEVLSTLPPLQTSILHGSAMGTLLTAALMAMGRLLFLPNPIFGLSLLILISLFDGKKAVYFSLGTFLATVVAHFVSRGTFAWEYGYFSYCAGLVGLGMASRLENFQARTILLFCTISCFLVMACEQFLAPLHLPSLSFPYVLCLWIASLSRSPRVSFGRSTQEIPYKTPLSAIMRAKHAKPAETPIESGAEVEKAS
jgi:urea transporter